MFRKMRRTKQQLAEEEARAIIERAKVGIMGVIGDDGYPYTVPVNTVLVGDKIYFHSAKSGHKIDAISENPKVSFSFIDKDDVVSREFTTYFRSAQVFGKAHVVTDTEEFNSAFRAICEKFSGADMDRYEEVMENESKAASVVCVEIEHIAAKEAMELVKQRGQVK